MPLPPPRSTLFPYTTLFRSEDALIDAVAAIIARVGLERATASRIARRAGLTSGAIYGRYKTQWLRSEEHTSELQSHSDLVCRLLLEKKKFANNQSKGRDNI